MIYQVEFPNYESALHHKVLRNAPLFVNLLNLANETTDDGRAEQFAMRVLHGLCELPGLAEDMTVKPEALETWIHEVKHLCKEQGHEEIADQQIGFLLAHAPSGADGAWPCEIVRDILDAAVSPDIETWFVNGKKNPSGHIAEVASAERERSLARCYRRDSAKIASRWPVTAKLLERLADYHYSEAQELDHLMINATCIKV